MRPADSAATFQQVVAASGTTVKEINVSQALAQMMAFYRDVRAEGCDPQDEEDTFIWKWGMCVQRQGPSFQAELTRCFIEPGTEDGMSRLSLTLQYTAISTLQALGRGSYWCGSPAESKAFEAAILASPAYSAVASLKTQAAELEWRVE